MQIRELHPAFGIQITEFDDTPDHTLAIAIRKFLLAAKVVVVRGANFSAPRYIELCARIGDHIWTTDDEMAAERHYQFENHKELVRVSNHDGLLGASELKWHADASHHPKKPYPIRCLYAWKMPANTATTTFADMEEAYRRLDPDLKAIIADWQVLHKPAYYVGWGDEDVWRPAVRTHPIIGSHSLSLDNHFTRTVRGMEPEFGKKQIDRLVDIATAKCNTFTHDWRKGDIIIFDNNNTLHRRERIAHEAERCLLRITMDW